MSPNKERECVCVEGGARKTRNGARPKARSSGAATTPSLCREQSAEAGG